MADYQAMYKELFRATTKVIDLLQKAQQVTEEIYISEEDATLTVFGSNTDEDSGAVRQVKGSDTE